MLQYQINLIGYIVERNRPDGFPRSVKMEQIVEVDSHDSLKTALNTIFASIRATNGMVIIKDGTIFRKEFQPDRTFFVPMHMITHIETETKFIAGEIPVPPFTITH